MDQAAVEELYRRYGSAVFRRARAILGNEAAARDAVQEVFIRVIRSQVEFHRDTSPMTWLYRVTTNYCLNRVRDFARRQKLLDQHTAGSDRAAPPSAEKRTTLAQILDRVPEQLRAVAIYRYVDQMSYDEIAAVMGVSRRTVGNRLDAFRTAARAAVK